MVEAHSPTARADAEIAADIEDIIVHYPPLVADRSHFRVGVNSGVAEVAGHMRSKNTRDFFMQALGRVEGLSGVNVDYLHVDEDIRLALGADIPVGIVANVDYGTVVLSGTLPEETTIDALVARIGGVPGVRRVIVALRE